MGRLIYLLYHWDRYSRPTFSFL